MPSLDNVIDLTEDNMFVIKNGKHTLTIKPGKLCQEEGFTNLVKCFNLKDKVSFKRIRGLKCCRLFKQEKQLERGGSHILQNDCMRFKICQDYFDIIKFNPKIISVLYSFRDGVDKNSENNVSGFCILFKDKDKIYFDRIYAYNTEDLILLENYCIDKKYTYLYDLNDKNLTLQLNKWQFDKYPYLDSFRYLNMKTGVLSLYREINENVVSLVGCNGNYNDFNY